MSLDDRETVPSAKTPALLRRFEAILRTEPALLTLLERLRSIDHPAFARTWRLVAGCLYQTVWNRLTDRPSGYGIDDYDVAYFDDGDIGYDAEDALIRRVSDAVDGFDGRVEVRNQARVHVWFPAKFGIDVPPLTSVEEAIGRYAARTHMVGVRLTSAGEIDIHAPADALEAIFAMRLVPGVALDNRASYERKARRCKAMWPELTVEPWPA